eukprot:1513604-Prymnesium_polylepis.1
MQEARARAAAEVPDDPRAAVLLSLSVAVAHPAAGNFVEGLVDTDVRLSSRGCVFEVSVVLPSGAIITLEGNHNTDTVGSL